MIDGPIVTPQQVRIALHRPPKAEREAHELIDRLIADGPPESPYEGTTLEIWLDFLKANRIRMMRSGD